MLFCYVILFKHDHLTFDWKDYFIHYLKEYLIFCRKYWEIPVTELPSSHMAGTELMPMRLHITSSLVQEINLILDRKYYLILGDRAAVLVCCCNR